MANRTRVLLGAFRRHGPGWYAARCEIRGEVFELVRGGVHGARSLAVLVPLARYDALERAERALAEQKET